MLKFLFSFFNLCRHTWIQKNCLKLKWWLCITKLSVCKFLTHLIPISLFSYLSYKRGIVHKYTVPSLYFHTCHKKEELFINTLYLSLQLSNYEILVVLQNLLLQALPPQHSWKLFQWSTSRERFNFNWYN